MQDISVVVNDTDINITVPDNSSVVVIIDGEVIYNESGVNGTTDIPLDDLEPGNHTVVIIITDGNGTTTVINETIEIPKRDVNLIVDAPLNVIVGQDAVITVSVDPVVSGEIRLIIGGKDTAVSIGSGGKVSFVVKGLGVGNYPFTVVYSGNDKYNNKTSTGSLTVMQNINVVVNDTDINITVPDNSSVVVIVDGEVIYNESGVNGTTDIPLDDLEPGNHTVVVIITDGNGTTHVTNETIEIPKRDVNLIVDAPWNVIVGQDVVITVSVDPVVSGEIRLIIGGKDTAVSIGSGGKVSFVVKGLGVGNYPFTVVYSGNDKYNNKTSTGSLTVMQDISVVVNDTDINITVPDNSTVVVIVDGEVIYNESGVNGTTDIPLDDLEPGNHTVVVIITDGNGTTTVINETIEVPKRDVNLIVDAPLNVIVGQDVVITVSVDPVVSGEIRLIIGGKDTAVSIGSGGKVSFVVKGLGVGNYPFTVVYSGNDKYNNKTSTGSLTVMQDISVVVNDTDINITVPDNSSVVVIVDGEVIYNESGVNGTTDIPLDDLEPGNHTVVVIVTDGNGTTHVTNETIEIPKRDVDLIIDAPNVVVGQDAVITVSVDPVVSGEIRLIIGGKDTAVSIGSGGKVSFVVKGLGVGNYPFTVVYSGNDKYNNKTSTGSLTVIQNINVVVNDTGVNITVPDNSSVVVIVDGEVIYNESGVNGTTDIPLDDLEPGNHTVTVIVTDSNGTTHVFNETIEVPLHTPDMVFDIPSVVPVVGGDDIVVELPKNATGNVTAIVDGKPVTTVPVEGGKAVIPFDSLGLTPGNHDIAIAYSGDGNYKPVRSEDSIVTVIKLPSTVRVEVSNINFGEVATITVTVPADATGIVLVDLGVAKSYGEIKDGKAVINVSGLSGGKYNVKAVYQGDSKYGESVGAGSFDVIGANYAIKVTMIDGLKLTAVLTDGYGNPVAGASVSYTLGNGEVVYVITNGKGEFVCDVESDSVLTMSYANGGDVLCNASITLKNMNPLRQSTWIDVPANMQMTASDFKKGEAGQIFAFYLRDANGNGLANKVIKIGIFDKKYTVKTDANGRAELPIRIENANYYTYAPAFLGDKDYEASLGVCSL